MTETLGSPQGADVTGLTGVIVDILAGKVIIDQAPNDIEGRPSLSICL